MASVADHVHAELIAVIFIMQNYYSHKYRQ